LTGCLDSQGRLRTLFQRRGRDSNPRRLSPRRFSRPSISIAMTGFLGGLCLGFCLHNVELCRRSRPESTRFGSSASPWWPCSYGVTSEWCGMKHPPVEIGRIHLDWARHRKAPVGDGSPSACHGSAVACIGQPPPPSAPGPVWGWRAGPLSRGCGGRAAGSRRGVGVGPHLSSRDCAAPVDSERIRLHWL